MELKDCGFNLEEIKKILKLKDPVKIEKLFKKKKADLIIQSNKINSSLERVSNKLKLLKFTEGTDMKEKILIVDDAGFMRMMVKDILTKNGYEVVEAADGAEGIAKFKTEKPDLVLMDITMPVMDGLTAIEEIKKIDSSAKIVMLSAMSQRSYVIDSFFKGAVEFTAKPFQADKLVQTVKKVLETDIAIDTDELILRQNEYNAKAADKPVAPKIIIDEQKLSGKIYEALKECIDESHGVNYDELAITLMKSVSNYINPPTVSGDKLTQDELDTLLAEIIKK